MKYLKYDNNSQELWFNSFEEVFDDDFYLFVLDWYINKNEVYAIGLDEQNYLKKMKIKDIQMGLYVWVLDEKKLKSLLVNLVHYSIEIVKLNNVYLNNGVTVFDSFVNKKRYEKNWMLYKIVTPTYGDSKHLYNIISNNVTLAYHIAVLSQWNVSMFLMMEMHVKSNNYIYCISLNNRFEYSNMVNQINSLPLVVYDIETVSNLDFRLPMGNFMADYIMSVTIIIDDVLYTLFNIPVTGQEDLVKAENMIKNVDTSKYYKIKNRKVYIFNNEIDLLNKMLDLFDSIATPYICLGYNTRGYDLPYILNRCVYLNIPHMVNFYFMNGILSYGKNMLHIDMNQVLVKCFKQELTSFTLKNVGKELLDDQIDIQKVDFNARNLRYIYQYISERNSIPEDGVFTSQMCNQIYEQWSVDLETLAKYNEMDCLVVLAVWDKLQYCDFIQYMSKHFFLPFTRCTLSKLNEYLSGNMIFMGLQEGVIFTQHYNNQVVSNDKFILKLDADKAAASEGTTTYGGGFNFRVGKSVHPVVYAMDAQAYYPELISGLNLSHETADIIHAKDLKAMIDQIPNFDESLYTFIKFCSHKFDIVTKSKSIEKIDQTITPFAFINYFKDNCRTLSYSEIEPNNDKIVVIYHGRKGILSNIIEKRNKLRNVAKSNKKQVNNYIDDIQNMITEMSLDNNNDQEDDEEGDDFDFDDDEDDAQSSKIYDIENYKIKKMEDQTEEEYLVCIQLELLEKKSFSKFENKLQAITDYSEHLKSEFVRINSHYRNMKLLNNSIYGLLGSSYGTLKGKTIAALVTMFGRMNIIEAAKLGDKINGSTVYSDTDSVYFDLSKALVDKPALYITNHMREKNKNVILNTKIYRNVFIIGRKTYIASLNDVIFSRGINKNGPDLWKITMNDLYTRYIVKHEDLLCEDVSDLLMNIYVKAFEVIKANKSQVLKTMSIQDKNFYKKELPITRLMDRIEKEYPTYTFGNKISCFYKTIGDVSNIHFALDFELTKTNIEDINIFKFYSNIIMTYYSIISYAIESTAKFKKNTIIKYSSLTFKKVNKIAYLKAVDKIR
ncbi:DNA polymerase [Aratus pisonii nudivirus]|nr:DNA polymerase [Aratus pisonii nudivirus]